MKYSVYLYIFYRVLHINSMLCNEFGSNPMGLCASSCPVCVRHCYLLNAFCPLCTRVTRSFHFESLFVAIRSSRFVDELKMFHHRSNDMFISYAQSLSDSSIYLVHCLAFLWLVYSELNCSCIHYNF